MKLISRRAVTLEIDFCFTSPLCRKRINFCDGVEDADLTGACERRLVEVSVIEATSHSTGPAVFCEALVVKMALLSNSTF